jgi:predicted phosphate transport protein (TIGR00153 family)
MRFFRRRTDFHTLLTEQAGKVEEGLAALVLYMKDPQYVHGQRVSHLEEDADDLRERIVMELNQAFVTPIDREDINELSRSVDDIIDYAKTTVEEMMAFEVSPNADMQKMAQGLHEAAAAIAEAVRYLRKDPARSNERVIFAKKRENFVEHCYREALVELFKGDNVVSILKMREIYRHLSNAADRIDGAANLIGDILMKSA